MHLAYKDYMTVAKPHEETLFILALNNHVHNRSPNLVDPSPTR